MRFQLSLFWRIWIYKSLSFRLGNLGINYMPIGLYVCWQEHTQYVVPEFGSPASSICLPFTKIEAHVLCQKQPFLLCKCTQHARHSRTGSFEDWKAYARLMLFYKNAYDLVAILLPQYITKAHQIYTSSPDTATTIINIHYCWLLFSTTVE